MFAMAMQLLRVLIAVVIMAILIPTLLLLVNHRALFQPIGTAVIRKDGNRLLGPPQEAKPLAQDELPYALLSEAAYQKAAAAAAGQSLEPSPSDVALESSGWTRWPAFFASDVEERFKKHHLRVEVWENDQLGVVAVAFGGTDPKNIQDWIANLRWFIPHHDDQYTDVVNEFGKLFNAEFLRRAQISPALSQEKLISTGHSLGGGLAQEFAYSLPHEDGVPKVSMVYAFAPSPVTGYFSVPEGTREDNRKKLSIDRIYERHEILAILRSVVNIFHAPSADNPQIREIRFNFKEKRNIVFRHSISELQKHLQAAGTGKD